MNITGKELIEAGWPPGPVFKTVLDAANAMLAEGADREKLLVRLAAIAQTPEDYLDDEAFGAAAQVLAEETPQAPGLCDTPAPYTVWGGDAIDSEALKQLYTACRLPVAVAGAQMPDGHMGYGLPIGGVLATRDAVIPYGVGVDIACRMKLSIIDAPASRLTGWRDRLKRALVDETRFGIGASFKGSDRRDHDVMDDVAWTDLPRSITYLKDKSWSQLGSSGSGNHFVEFGELVLDHADLGLEPGTYLAMLSHSGSRGLGAAIAHKYTQIAMERTPLPRECRHLSWLNLKSSAGQEYWTAMNLAGRYAAANHDLIHRHVLRAAKLDAALQLENHHNFAWIEEHGGEQVVVHRKGATPADAGVLGIIPGSMADPGFVVRGLGNAKSLNSASHGAGRQMSRSAAKKTITRSEMKKYLKENGVELLAGGLDESPQAYKPIREVMAAQSDLVEIVATFQPRIVLMAADGKAED